MMKHLNKFAPLLFFFLLLTSCTKVSPEDPTISLLTRKARITNTWKLNTMLNLGKAVSGSTVQSMELTLEEEDIFDNAEYTWEITHIGGISTLEEGEWRIKSTDKRIIEFTIPSYYEFDDGVYTNYPAVTTEYYLYKVSRKELWLRALGKAPCDGANEFLFVAQ